MQEDNFQTEKAAFPQIENVEILSLLGKGAMATVYKGRQKLLDRIVAVKVLGKNILHGESRLKRFQLEAKLSSNLNHPNIVQTLGSGLTLEGEPYLLLEYLQGESLAEELANHAPLSFRRVQAIFLPVLAALEYAHKQGIVHRDVKPANIMICRAPGEVESIKLLDFGIARLLEQVSGNAQITQTGVSVGSPNYMSPEQCQNKELDGRTDLYSLSCVLYEAVSGLPPFHGDSALSVMQKHVSETPASAAELSAKMELPESFARLLLWGLAKDPKDRPQTADEFAGKMRAVFDEITLDRAPRPKEKELASKARYLGMFSCAMLAILACFVLQSYYQRSQRTKEASAIQIEKISTAQRLRKQRLEKAKQYVMQAESAKEKRQLRQVEAYARKALLEFAHPADDTTKNVENSRADTAVYKRIADALTGSSVCFPSMFDTELHYIINKNHSFVDRDDDTIFALNTVKNFGVYGKLSSANDTMIACARICFDDKNYKVLEELLSSAHFYIKKQDNLNHEDSTCQTSILLEIAESYASMLRGDKNLARKQVAHAEFLFSKYKKQDVLLPRHIYKDNEELADIYEVIGDYSKEEEHLRENTKFMKVLLALGYKETVFICMSKLADFLCKRAKHSQAIAELKEVQATCDSSQKEDFARKIAEIKTRELEWVKNH